MAKKKPLKKKKAAPKKPAKKVVKKKPVKKAVVTEPTLPKSSVGIVPLGDRVLISEIEVEAETQTASGIYIPESAQKESKDSKRGRVVAIGDGRTENGVHIPVRVAVGDTVLFSWGDAITVKGVEYQLVNEGNISAIIN